MRSRPTIPVHSNTHRHPPSDKPGLRSKLVHRNPLTLPSPPWNEKGNYGRFNEIRSVIAIVGNFGFFVAGFCASATRLWPSTEARSYVFLGAAIAEQFDFRDEMFLLRTPGYPMMLAGIFALFRSHSSWVLFLIQHAMFVVVAVVTACVAWRVSGRRDVALLSGLLTTMSLPLLGFAAMIMSEVPFSLATVLCALGLARYATHGGRLSLIFASSAAGIGYLIRPIGLLHVVACVLAAIFRSLRHGGESSFCKTVDEPPISKARGGGHKRLSAIVCAIFPAMILSIPWVAHVRTLGKGEVSNSAGPALYKRLITIDRLDAPHSEALREIRNVVEEARGRGILSPTDDYHNGGVVMAAFQGLQGDSSARVCSILRRAAIDVFLEHPREAAGRTLRHVAWMILTPDSSYRYLPGGAPGKTADGGIRIRDAEAEVFDCATYTPMMRRYLDPFQHYLSFDDSPTVTTPLWTPLVRYYHRLVEKHREAFGIRWTVHDVCVLLSMLGYLSGFLVGNRLGWALLGSMAAMQIVVSALLVGGVPRYAVPAYPLILIGTANALACMFRMATIVISRTFSQHRRDSALDGNSVQRRVMCDES